MEGDKNVVETSETHFVKQYKPGSQARVELKNGRILDVVNGCYFDVGTSVILQDGKIESMPGLVSEPRVPVDFTIDLKGKTVLPSLFNTHCHLIQFEPTMALDISDMRQTNRYKEQQKEKNLSECLAHGITHIRDAWHPDLRENRALQERIVKGEIPGPRIVQSVVVGPTGSYMQEKPTFVMKITRMPQSDTSKVYGGAVAFPSEATEGQVRAAVDTAIDERGAEVIKIGDETFSLFAQKAVPVMTTEQLCVLADQARRRGVPTTMHHSSVESFRRGAQAGITSLAHAPWDGLLSQEDIKAFIASGCFCEPTVSAFYGMLSWKTKGGGLNNHPVLNRLTDFRDRTHTFADIAEEYYIPELRAVVMNGYRRFDSGKPKMMGIMDMSAMAAFSEKTVTYFENFCLLFENGVPLAAGNDNKPPCTPAMTDLELLMFDHLLQGKPNGRQLRGADAVKIATINSARSLGLEDKFGSIETGKTADLIILDGDPLEDFRLIGSRVAALFMDGKLVINNCDLDVEPYRKVYDRDKVSSGLVDDEN
jgi:imidazolonepropionase-like amidohydrolase